MLVFSTFFSKPKTTGWQHLVKETQTKMCAARTPFFGMFSVISGNPFFYKHFHCAMEICFCLLVCPVLFMDYKRRLFTHHYHSGSRRLSGIFRCNLNRRHQVSYLVVFIQSYTRILDSTPFPKSAPLSMKTELWLRIPPNEMRQTLQTLR